MSISSRPNPHPNRFLFSNAVVTDSYHSAIPVSHIAEGVIAVVSPFDQSLDEDHPHAIPPFVASSSSSVSMTPAIPIDADLIDETGPFIDQNVSDVAGLCNSTAGSDHHVSSDKEPTNEEHLVAVHDIAIAGQANDVNPADDLLPPLVRSRTTITRIANGKLELRETAFAESSRR